jgi:hypothetical protein
MDKIVVGLSPSVTFAVHILWTIISLAKCSWKEAAVSLLPGSTMDPSQLSACLPLASVVLIDPAVGSLMLLYLSTGTYYLVARINLTRLKKSMNDQKRSSKTVDVGYNEWTNGFLLCSKQTLEHRKWVVSCSMKLALIWGWFEHMTREIARQWM